MQLLKSPALACALEQHLHPELIAIKPALWSLSEHYTACDWNNAPPSTEQHVAAVEWLDKTRYTYGVHTVPFLSAAFCEAVVAEAAAWKHKPNEQEDEAFRIPEVVLNYECPTLFRTCSELVQGAMWPVLHLIFGQVPQQINSIQLAQYNPQGTAHGNWHHDEDSDQTIVVSLAPDLFEGGGTDIMFNPATLEYMTLPPLPQGHALVFPGKQMLHRGRHVSSGSRHLLVFWMETK